jgi:predicted MFS family arabinose efflux permease
MSGAVAIVALVLIAVADTVTDFAMAMAVQGLWRALDSGPLESWYVDTAHAADADADITSGLGAGATAQNLAMAGGALASGAIVALGRAADGPALVLPVLVAVAMTALGTLAVAALVRENRPMDTVTRRARWASALAQTPAVMREVVGLLRSSRVLLALIAVEVFWGFGMVSFETFMPLRLGEVLASPERAGVWMGPITSAGWAAAAGGAALAPLLSRRIGLAPVAAGTRILQGATVVGIGLFTGPVGVVTAYVACYAVHGSSNPVHNALLHLQARNGNRTAVLSLNSMVAQPAFAVGSLALGALADRASTSAAMVAAAVALALAAPLYLPAWHYRGQTPSADTVTTQSPSPDQ